MEYFGENMSTTLDKTVSNEWSIDVLDNSKFDLMGLVETLRIIQMFKNKYPNDEYVSGFDEIVRDEICQMFGGSLGD